MCDTPMGDVNLRDCRCREDEALCTHCDRPLAEGGHAIVGGYATEGEVFCSEECYDAHTEEPDDAE